MSAAVELIRKVDREARDAITYERDALVRGIREDWQTAEETAKRRLGDCEDFAIYAASRLMDRGVPAACLYLTLVHTEDRRGFNHCVLLVQTAGGLMTCGDTRSDGPLPLIEAYDESMMRQYARLDKPRDWYGWNKGD